MFCLSAVLCPGCKSSPKKSSEVKVSSKEENKTPNKKPVQSGDKKASQNEIKPPQQQSIPPHSTPSQPVASTASQDINQEKRKKVLGDFSQQTIMAGVEKCLRQQFNLPDQKIKDIKESVQDNLLKLEKIFNALLSGERQLLLDYLVKSSEPQQGIDESNKQVFEKFRQLGNLVNKGKDCQVDVKGNASEPIFQDMIKAGREAYENCLLYLTEFISACMKMEKGFLKCSPKEKETYLPHLKDIISLLNNHKLLIQREKKLPQKKLPQIPSHLLPVLQQVEQFNMSIQEKANFHNRTAQQVIR